LNTAIAQAETFLENTPVSTFPDTGTAAERYTSLTKAVKFYAQRRMMGFGNKVILKGRDPRLHGQEGIMNLGNNPDEADKNRPMISLEDGTQVSNIHFQVNVFYTLFIANLLVRGADICFLFIRSCVLTLRTPTFKARLSP
jgi:hypothetical protein